MWYRNSNFRNLVDMHIPDWNPAYLQQFDPEQYADCMARAGVDTALVYAGNCLGICFFPTKVGHMHEGLHGRDIFGETVEALKERGIRPITYFNIWSRWGYDTHPDWRIVHSDGDTSVARHDGTMYSRFGCCCLNAPGYRDYVKAQFTQLASDYDTAGFWIDMCGWHGHVCTCGHCRARYLAETGRELPSHVDFNDPEWVEFIRIRERWTYDFNHMIRKTVDETRPGRTCAFQSAFWRSGWRNPFTMSYAGLSDYLAGDFYGNPLMYAWYCKALSNITTNRPMEFMISRCQNLNDHTTTKTDEELRFSAWSALAHGAAFLFIDAIDPKGTLDTRLYDRMGEIKKELAPYLNVWNPEARVCPEVSFYWNFPSMIDKSDDGKEISNPFAWTPANRMAKAAQTMIEGHLAYDFTTKFTDVPQDAVLVLSEQRILTEPERKALAQFVENGGKLVITGNTGTQEIGGKAASLDTLTGVKLNGYFAEDTSYLCPVKGCEALFENVTPEYPLFFKAAAPNVQVAPDVRVLATVTRSASSSKEVFRFGSAISNPPETATDMPAVTLRTVGKGQILWIGVPLFDSETPIQRKVFVNLQVFIIHVSVFPITSGVVFVDLRLIFVKT